MIAAGPTGGGAAPAKSSSPTPRRCGRRPRRGPRGRRTAIAELPREEGVRRHKPLYEDLPGGERFERLAGVAKAGVQVVVAPTLFPTPFAVAQQVVGMADLRSGHRVLEPSAGTGNLVKAAIAECNDITIEAIELNVRVAQVLADAGFLVMNRDFLEEYPGGQGGIGLYDRVVMNPPFDKGADVKHVLHAVKFLKPDGRLVAVVAAGPRQREAFESKASAWVDLPAGSFKESGTDVNTAIVVIDREEWEWGE
jgi:predicted RNA methylase